MRPKVVGSALNEIAKQDPEIIQAVMEVMETDQLLSSGASLDILPEKSSVLVQLSDSDANSPAASSLAQA